MSSVALPRSRQTTVRRRWFVALGATVVAAVCLGVKAWAETVLPAGAVGSGLLSLRLAFNSGVAFSVGADAPTWLVTSVTAAVVLGVAVVAWRTARDGNRSQLVAFALVLGGAAANVADRAADGVVTDYLHTGWWPTFNLPDTAIVVGAVLLVAAPWIHARSNRADHDEEER